MNSRYTYKAKIKDSGEWIEGCYVYEEYSNRHYITLQLNNAHQLIEIIPETICQCTGLKDKNDNYIFENDIVEYKTPKYNDKTKRINYKKVKRIVVYDISMGMYCLAKSSEEKDIICSDIFDLKNKIWYCKIIGNKFDEVEE